MTNKESSPDIDQMPLGAPVRHGSLSFAYVIFSWPGWEDNAASTLRRLQKAGRSSVVISSGVDLPLPGWITVPEDYYFGEQFCHAASLFAGRVMVHIQADAHVPDIEKFVWAVETAFTRTCLGIWAPDVDYTHWKTSRVRIPVSSSRLSLARSEVPVVNTDCTCWAIHPAVLDDFARVDTSTLHFGFGIDWTLAAIALLQGRIVVRDTSILVEHPKSTNYSSDAALEEFEAFREKLPGDIQLAVALLEGIAAKNTEAEFRERLRRLFRSARSELLKWSTRGA